MDGWTTNGEGDGSFGGRDTTIGAVVVAGQPGERTIGICIRAACQLDGMNDRAVIDRRDLPHFRRTEIVGVGE